MGLTIRGLIFDLDGTLCDTIPVCIAGFREAFARHAGREFSEAEIVALFGPTEEGIIKQVVPDAWEACVEDYLAAYERAHAACPAPFDGLIPLLAELRADGIRLAVVTGKGPRSCQISLRRLGLAECFDAVETGSDDGAIKADRIQAVLRRWDLPPEQAAYVGDVPSDVRDAREVGVVALAAAWASSADRDALRAERPDALFTTVEAFAEWVRDHVRRD